MPPPRRLDGTDNTYSHLYFLAHRLTWLPCRVITARTAPRSNQTEYSVAARKGVMRSYRIRSPCLQLTGCIKGCLPRSPPPLLADMAIQSPFRRVLLLATAVCMMFLAVEGTQIMHRPAEYKNRPKTFKQEKNPKVNTIQRRASGKSSFGYFTNWGIYGANFQPSNVVSNILTHILYSFADVNPSTGAISLTDSYADVEKHYPDDSWSEPGNNMYGCLKQLYLIKMKQRNLKVLLSIGGWTYSQAGHFNFVTDATARATFVSNAVQMIEDYGFDGIDIDFEFPSSDAQGQGLADLFTALRSAFDALASRKGDSTPYLLTAAVSAGPVNYQYLKVPQMDQAMDYWNLMAYDYAGSWLTYADNQANLYGGARTGFNTDSAFKWYLSKGASASKINLGMPLYGRAFENTAGLGQSYSGVGPGTIEAGVYSYKALPIAGAQVYENTTDVSSYSYDSAKKELVSYDTPNIVNIKSKYINSNGMAGSMFWELSTDKVGSESLVGTAAGVLGGLDTTQNHISYPNSKYDNLRNNFGTGSGTTSAPSTTTSTSPTTTPGTGTCAGVAAWVSSTAYVGGQTVTYGGHLWTAKWWTQNETPGVSTSGVWTDSGAC